MCLKLFNRNNKCPQYATMDETWVHHFTSPNDNQLCGAALANLAQSGQRRSSRLVGLWCPYFGIYREFCLSTTLKNKKPKERLLLWIIGATEEETCVRGFKWRRKKCSTTKPIHHKSTNSTVKLNQLRFECPRHTCSPEKTSKECQRERDLGQLKRWPMNRGLFWDQDKSPRQSRKVSNRLFFPPNTDNFFLYNSAEFLYCVLLAYNIYRSKVGSLSWLSDIIKGR